MSRILSLSGFLLGLYVLIFQFSITIPAGMEAGRSLGGAVVHYFSYFTILSNILVTLVHGANLFKTPRFFQSPSVQGAVLAAIILVASVYWTLLWPLWQPSGLMLVNDVILHAIAPALYLLWWLAGAAHGALSMRDVPRWMIYPIVYVIYALARAPIAGEVPYPFLDASEKGWPSVLSTIGAMALFFAVLSMCIVWLDRWLDARGERKG